MSYQFYKILHMTSLFALFVSLAAVAFVPDEKRKPWMAIHGIATLIALVAGFGLLARLGLMRSFPSWVFIKLGIWLTLGAMPAILRRKRDLALPVLLVTVLLGALGSYTALHKPGQNTEAAAEVPAEATVETAPTPSAGN